MKTSLIQRLLFGSMLLASALITGASPNAYVISQYKWGSPTVSYYVNPQNKWVSQNAAISAFQSAAAVWREQTRANIQLAYAGQTNGSSVGLNYKNEVFFRSGATGSSGAVGYAWYDGSGRLVDGDIMVYEDNYQFFAFSGCSNGLYLENIAVHEFGHVMGLYHSEVPGAVMQPYMSSYCDQSYMQLTPDDVSGLEALYPPATGSTNAAPVVSVTSPGSSGSYSDGTVISFSGSATDREDGNITANLRWTSNLIGTIGNGGNFARTLPAGVHVITAAALDSGGLSGSQWGTLTVTASPSAAPPPPPSPAPGGATLTVRAYKVKGFQRADLTWSGLTADTVVIYRNGTAVSTVGNSGSATDAIDKKGGGSYTYRVCAAGTSTCTSNATASF